MEKLCSKWAMDIAKHSGSIEKYEIYKYGLESTFCMLTPSIVICGISIFLHLELEAFTWLLFFLPLRMIFGGAHAKKQLNCTIISVIAALIGFLPLNFINIKPIAEMILTILCTYVMIHFSCSRELKSETSFEAYRKMRHKEFFVLCIVVCSCFALLLCKSSLHFVIFRSLLIATLSFVISLFQK